ncbi:hypothetical protein Tco_0113659 [Tanacetum coccineum]
MVNLIVKFQHFCFAVSDRDIRDRDSRDCISIRDGEAKVAVLRAQQQNITKAFRERSCLLKAPTTIITIAADKQKIKSIVADKDTASWNTITMWYGMWALTVEHNHYVVWDVGIDGASTSHEEEDKKG